VLDQLERPSMAIETLDVLGEAIKNRHVHGSIFSLTWVPQG
jgi:hypothetical protein